VIFSYTPEDSELALASLNQILNSEGFYQKYLISRLILNNCENFVISPAYCEDWTFEKREDILAYFKRTLYSGDLDIENENFYLF
jgi:hypothetical protein